MRSSRCLRPAACQAGTCHVIHFFHTLLAIISSFQVALKEACLLAQFEIAVYTHNASRIKKTSKAVLVYLDSDCNGFELSIGTCSGWQIGTRSVGKWKKLKMYQHAPRTTRTPPFYSAIPFFFFLC
jgi:hypothetical protein